MTERKVVAASVLAVRHVCEICAKHLVGHLQPLLELFIKFAPTLGIRDQGELIQGVAAAVSIAPGNVVADATRAMVFPFVTMLHEAARATPPDERAAGIALDCIGSIFQFVQPPTQGLQEGNHPCVPLVKELWPTFISLMQLFASNPPLLERVCRVIRHLQKCLQFAFTPFLQELVTAVLQLFSTHPHACFIHVMTETVSLFAREQTYHEPMMQVLQALAPVAISRVNVQPQSNVPPDVLGEFFELLSVYIWRLPNQFLESALFDGVVQLAGNFMLFQHREALRAVLTFLNNIFSLCLHPAPASSAQRKEVRASSQAHAVSPLTATARGKLQNLLAQHFAAFVRMLLLGAVGQVTAYCMPEIAVAFKTLLRVSPELVPQWVAAALADQQTFPFSPQEKSRFVAQLVQANQEVDPSHVIVSALDRLYMAANEGLDS
jgi:hypothetical protein